MAPLTDILIAKIVLGYLSSRKLQKTSDCFIKESEALNINTSINNKGRILNHLEDQKLLPSLEEILDDYFAYQETDGTTTDKTYMLWKQLDVILSQLRGITLGKNKSKAFLRARRSGPNLGHFISNKYDTGEASPEFFKPRSDQHCEFSTSTDGADEQRPDGNDLQDCTHQNDKKRGDYLDGINMLSNQDSSCTLPQMKNSSPEENLGAMTPRKEKLKTELIKDFKSPKRKSLRPKRRSDSLLPSLSKSVESTPAKQVEDASSTIISPLFNEEFTHIVEALIGNYSLQEKLADNINKVASSDSHNLSTSVVEKDPVNVNEVYKLTADDPDFNALFSMLGDLNHGDDLFKQHLFFPSKDTLSIQQECLPHHAHIVGDHAINSSQITFSQQPLTTEGQYVSSVTQTAPTGIRSDYETVQSCLKNTGKHVESTSDCYGSNSNIAGTTSTMLSIFHQPLYTTVSSNCQGNTSTVLNSTKIIPSVMITTTTNESVIPQPSFMSLLNDDSNFYPCGDIAPINEFMTNEKTSVVRNLHAEMRTCCEMETVIPPNSAYAAAGISEHSSSLQVSSMSNCHAEDKKTIISDYQEVEKSLLTENESLLGNIFETQELHFNLSPSKSRQQSFTSTTLKTPTKIFMEQIGSTEVMNRSESVSIATDALLLLSTSPAKLSKNKKTFDNIFNDESNGYTVEHSMDTPAQSNRVVSSLVNTITSLHPVDQTKPNNMSISKEILVSDKYALSHIPYTTDIATTSESSNQKQKTEFFEQPHRNLSDVVTILPKPVTISPEISCAVVLKNTVSKEVKRSKMSIADQLAEQGRIVNAKKKNAKKDKKDFVPRFFNFGPIKFFNSADIVPSSYIPAMKPTDTPPCNAQHSKYNSIAIELPSNVSPSNITTPLNPHNISSELNALIVSRNVEMIPIESPSILYQKALSRSHDSVNTFRITGGTFSTLKKETTNTKSPIKTLQHDAIKSPIKTLHHSDIKSPIKTDNILKDQPSSILKIVKSPKKERTMLSLKKKIGSKSCSLSSLNDVVPKLKSPAKKSQQHKKELKVKFDFKSPKKKHVHFSDTNGKNRNQIEVKSPVKTITNSVIIETTPFQNDRDENIEIINLSDESPMIVNRKPLTCLSTLCRTSTVDEIVEKLIMQGNGDIEIIVTEDIVDDDTDNGGNFSVDSHDTVETALNIKESVCVESSNASPSILNRSVSPKLPNKLVCTENGGSPTVLNEFVCTENGGSPTVLNEFVCTENGGSPTVLNEFVCTENGSSVSPAVRKESVSAENNSSVSPTVFNDRTTQEKNSNNEKIESKKRKYSETQGNEKLLKKKKKRKRKSSLESLLSLGADRFLAKVKI